MKLFKKNRLCQDEKNIYQQLRGEALKRKMEDFGIQTGNSNQAYGAIIDMDMDSRTVTLVCMVDGSTSLYFSNGGGIIGLGQGHETVALATKNFLKNTNNSIMGLSITSDFSIPTGGKHKAFLLFPDGIYSVLINPQNINDESQYIQDLFKQYNYVIYECSKVQE